MVDTGDHTNKAGWCNRRGHKMHYETFCRSVMACGIAKTWPLFVVVFDVFNRDGPRNAETFVTVVCFVVDLTVGYFVKFA